MASLDFRRYRQVFSAPGAPWFSIAGWLGRFPRSALSLSLIIAVSARSGSFALAGLVSAAFIVAMAVAGPVWSRAMDRRGQSRVLAVSYALTALTTTALAIVALTGAPDPWWFAAAVATGASLCDVGAAVRTRWTHLLEPGERHAAFAVETMVDESVFIVAPPLVTLIATAVDPVLGIVVAAVTGVIGGALLVASRSSAPAVSPRASSGVRHAVLPPVVIWPVVLSVVGIGAMFGAFDVTAVGWADELGRHWLTGSIMATMSVGNTVGSMFFGAVGWQWSLRRRYLLTGALLAAAGALLPLASGIVARHLAVALVGVVLGPVMVSGVALLESRVDHSRVTEMLSWQGLGVSAGVPIGGTIGGRAIDASGTHSSVIVMAVCAASVVVVASVGELLLGLRPASRAGAPAAPAPPAPSSEPRERGDSPSARSR